METDSMQFRIDTANFLKEIADNALPRNMGVLFIPLNIFRLLLCEVAKRAIKINDPELNILMLRLTLYEVQANEIHKAIEDQMKLITKEPDLTPEQVAKFDSEFNQWAEKHLED